MLKPNGGPPRWRWVTFGTDSSQLSWCIQLRSSLVCSATKMQSAHRPIIIAIADSVQPHTRHLKEPRATQGGFCRDVEGFSAQCFPIPVRRRLACSRRDHIAVSQHVKGTSERVGTASFVRTIRRDGWYALWSLVGTFRFWAIELTRVVWVMSDSGNVLAV